MIVWIWMFQLRGMTLARGRSQVCACSHFSAKATKGNPTEFLSPMRMHMCKSRKELKWITDTTPDLDNLKELGSRTLQNTQELCIGFVNWFSRMTVVCTRGKATDYFRRSKVGNTFWHRVEFAFDWCISIPDCDFSLLPASSPSPRYHALLSACILSPALVFSCLFVYQRLCSPLI